MEVTARLKNARISAQKVRLVADQVRGLPVEKAEQLLTFSTKKAAHIVKKVLLSAVAKPAVVMMQVTWNSASRAAGVAGPASLASLVKYARLCGVNASVGMLAKAGGKLYSARKSVKVTIGGCGG